MRSTGSNETLDSSYPVCVVGTGSIFDGPVVTWISQHFDNTENGIKLKLQFFYPSACPDAYYAFLIHGRVVPSIH